MCVRMHVGWRCVHVNAYRCVCGGAWERAHECACITLLVRVFEHIHASVHACVCEYINERQCNCLVFQTSRTFIA